MKVYLFMLSVTGSGAEVCINMNRYIHVLSCIKRLSEKIDFQIYQLRILVRRKSRVLARRQRILSSSQGCGDSGDALEGSVGGRGTVAKITRQYF